MKSLLSILFSLLLVFLLCASLPTEGEEALYSEVVRLHILAASDTAEDQGIKIAVRDALLSSYGETLSSFSDSETASAYLKGALPSIEKTVEGCLEELGVLRTVKIEIKEDYFETRAYDSITLPQGTYTSLTVTLGEGKGQNWWCVLYPALCTEGAFGEKIEAEEAFTKSEYKLLTKSGYAIKFRTLELLGSIFPK